jgi:hypothetical protein
MSGMDIRLDYLLKDGKARGRARYYVRIKGKKIRLSAPFGTQEFYDEYWQARKALEARSQSDNGAAKRRIFAPKTLGWLIDRYLKESPLYISMVASGKKRRANILHALQDAHGDKPMIMPNERRVGEGLLKVVSTGMLVEDEGTALMWRGLMLTKAVEQFLNDVQWGHLDYLVIDMPPGTGDVQMGLARMLPRTDLLIVTTPAVSAQKVAIRAADMARRSFLRVAGVIENMSAFECDHGESYALFGTGGGQALADEIGVELLGQVPIEPTVAAGGDAIQIQGATPFVLDSAKATASARAAAVANARAKARSYAELLDVKLGKVTYLVENSSPVSYVPLMGVAKAADSMATEIDLGNQDVTVSITIRWSLV